MDKSIDSIGSCSLDADSTDFSGNFNMKRENGNKMGKKQHRSIACLSMLEDIQACN